MHNLSLVICLPIVAKNSMEMKRVMNRVLYE